MPQWKLYFRFTKQFNLEQITYLEVDVYGPPCISAVVGVEATIFPPPPTHPDLRICEIAL